MSLQGRYQLQKQYEQWKQGKEGKYYTSVENQIALVKRWLVIRKKFQFEAPVINVDGDDIRMFANPLMLTDAEFITWGDFERIVELWEIKKMV